MLYQEAVKRLLRARMRSNPFCAVMWGDLNNRLVAYQACTTECEFVNVTITVSLL